MIEYEIDELTHYARYVGNVWRGWVQDDCTGTSRYVYQHLKHDESWQKT